jgi:hypothetical protein
MLRGGSRPNGPDRVTVGLSRPLVVDEVVLG